MAAPTAAIGEEDVEVGDGLPPPMETEAAMAASTERNPLLSLQVDMEESLRMTQPIPPPGR